MLILNHAIHCIVQIIKCEDTLELVMSTASDVLDINASIIYTAMGGQLTNAELIR